MKVFDKSIEKTLETLKDFDQTKYGFDSSVSWNKLDSSELILGKDIAVELGSSHLKGAEYTMVTTNMDLIKEDQIVIIGDDLKNLKGESVSFAKIVIIKLKGFNEEDPYSKIKDLERVKFRVHLEGYMLRASTHQKRETVRISKDAVKKGLSFQTVGNLLIEEYKKNDYVENVEVIFITRNDKLIENLANEATRVREIIDAMNHIFDDIEFNCKACSFSSICDEIEGMKEMHSKKKRYNNNLQ